jgi:hypothetical protein
MENQITHPSPVARKSPLKRIVQYSVIVALTVLLLYFLLRQVNVIDIWRAMVSVGPWWLLASFIFYFLSVVIRAVRFRLLTRKQIPFGTMMNIVFVHNFSNGLLPSFLGELSFVYLARKTGKNSVGEATAALIIARFFDMCAVFALTAVALMYIPDAPQQFRSLLLAMGVIVFVLLVGFVVVVANRHRSLRIMWRIGEVMHVQHLRMFTWFIAKSHEAIDAIESLHTPKMYAMTIVVSLVVWILSYFQIYVLMVAMGYTLSFMAVALGTSLFRLATTLPVYGVAGFGTVELTWAAAFILLGMTTQDAIVSGFSVHVLTLGFAIILGLIGGASLWRRPWAETTKQVI